MINMSESELSIHLTVSSVEKYPAKQHVQRVAKELGAKDGHIYLLGQYELLTEDSDAARPWKQRRYFYYCSGVDVPDCCLVYRIEDDELVLYIPKIVPKKVIWMGRPPTIAEAMAKYDVDSVRHNSDLFDDLKSWVGAKKSAPFYVLHPTHKPEMDFPSLNTEDLQPAMDKCRTIKDQYEIQCIRKANDISAKAHRAVLRNIKRLTTEAEIQGLFEYTLTANERTRPAYATIAGSGPNAGILHYSENKDSLEGRQLVVMDAGAEWGLYASDVTRTFPISGHFTEDARAIYALVELMQTSCIEALKPGVKMWDLHQHCHRLLTQGFMKLGIFHNGTFDEILAAGTSKGFLPHGLGHHLGLEVHDTIRRPILRYSPPDTSSSSSSSSTSSTSTSAPTSTPNHPSTTAGGGRLERVSAPIVSARRAEFAEKHSQQREKESTTRYARLHDTILEPCAPANPALLEGMVVTIEPGVYFNRYELTRAYLHTAPHRQYINRAVLDRFWAVGGCRIEDDLLITATGSENLTTAPKGDEALDLIRKGRGRDADDGGEDWI